MKGYPVSLIIDKIKDGLMTKRDAVISVLRAMDMGSASLLAESFHVGGLNMHSFH